MDSEAIARQARTEKYRRYRARHPEKVKAAGKAWREANPEKVKARNAASNMARSKEAHSEYMREWRKRQPEKAKSSDLRKQYGIDLAEYREKEDAQGGVCAICGDPPGARALAVDHCHATGVVRDLLCHQCNTAIGLAKESPARLLALAEYLRRWGKD